MSQYGGTLATASNRKPLLSVVLNSSADTSYFEFTADVGDLVVATVTWASTPNYTSGVTESTYALINSSGSVLHITTSTNTAEMKVDYEIPVSGTYYLRLVSTTNNEALAIVTSRVPSIDGVNRGIHRQVTRQGFVLPTQKIRNRILSFNERPIEQTQTINEYHVGFPGGEYYNGSGTIQGVLKVSDTLAQRKVRLYSKVEGLLLATTWSDPVTGVYEFKNRATLAERADAYYFTTGHDYEGIESSDIADNVVAVQI